MARKDLKEVREKAVKIPGGRVIGVSLREKERKGIEGSKCRQIFPGV